MTASSEPLNTLGQTLELTPKLDGERRLHRSSSPSSPMHPRQRVSTPSQQLLDGQADVFGDLARQDGHIAHRLPDHHQLSADELRLQSGLTVLEEHGDNFLEILIELVQALRLTVSAGKTRDVTHVNSGLRALFDDDGVGIHHWGSRVIVAPSFQGDPSFDDTSNFTPRLRSTLITVS